MGTMIDNAIHDTEVMKEYLEYRDEPRSWGLGVLIDIAHKYQKIQEIVEHWACCGNPSESIIAISEVLEDGNDD